MLEIEQLSTKLSIKINWEVHLVEQYRYPVRERFWEFPQGS